MFQMRVLGAGPAGSFEAACGGAGAARGRATAAIIARLIAAARFRMLLNRTVVSSVVATERFAS